MTAFALWLRRFRDLHERSRKGGLGAGEEATYQSMREELARTMLAAQKLALQPGQQARRTLRVARALPVEVELEGQEQRTLTLDVSAGGFSTLLARPPAAGAVVGVTLRLPGSEPIKCQASISEVKPLPGSARVSAQFLDLQPKALARLEHFVTDAVLALLQD